MAWIWLAYGDWVEHMTYLASRSNDDTNEGKYPVDDRDEDNLPVGVTSLSRISSQVRLRNISKSRQQSAVKLTMLMARVVLPEIATLIPANQAQDLAEPVRAVCCWKMGPPPPACLTAQPRVAKAATIAKRDLTKNNHRIFLGGIITSGNWTEDIFSTVLQWRAD